MRITFITPAADRSGGARVIDVYARALQARGHDVCVVTCPVARSLKNRIAGFLEDGKLRPATSTSDLHIREGAYEIRIAAPWKPIGPECVPDADVVIATFFVTANWVARYPASKGKKVHFVQHYELFDGVTKQELDASLRLPLTKITISTWLAKVLADLGAAADVVIPNSVDTKLFSAPPRRRQAAPTVGIMHSTASYKDTGTGLRAFELLRRKMPDVRLVAFGTSPPRGSLSLPRDANFVLRPPQDQIRKSMHRPTYGCARARRRGSDCRCSRPWHAGVPPSRQLSAARSTSWRMGSRVSSFRPKIPLPLRTDSSAS